MLPAGQYVSSGEILPLAVVSAATGLSVCFAVFSRIVFDFCGTILTRILFSDIIKRYRLNRTSDMGERGFEKCRA